MEPSLDLADDQRPINLGLTDENILKKLVTEYNVLIEMRRRAVGIVVSKGMVESQEMIAGLERELQSLRLDTKLGISRIRDSFMKVFKKETCLEIADIIFHIQNIMKQYTAYTHLREKYGLLAPVAFCDEADLPQCLGGDESKCDLTSTWMVDLQQIRVEDTGLGLLEVLGVDGKTLLMWWNETDFGNNEETRVWADIKKLARKLVVLFDWLREQSEIILAAIEKTKALTNDEISNILPTLKTLVLELIRLLYIRPGNTQDVLTFFNYLVPVVFAFGFALIYSEEALKPEGFAVVRALFSYTNVLSCWKDRLLKQLAAEEEIRSYSITDNGALASLSLAKRSTLKKPATENDKIILGTKQETVKALKEMGLEEKAITLGSKVDNGSFATVLECHSDNGGQKLAVKFINATLPNDPLRIQNRLLREAAFWSKLKHENINALVGFCVHPEYDFPGFLSRRCEYSLHTFLRTEGGKIASNSDKLCFMYDIVNGLDHMHKLKIIHGDLRPPNVLLVPNILGYSAVLSDFGVSYLDAESCDYSHTTLMHTSIPYIAPELFAKRNKKEEMMVSAPGDVYAFGCVFLETMCGIQPYDNRRVEKNKKNGVLPARKDQVDAKFWEFLCKTWHPSPQNRPKADELMLHIHNLKLTELA